MRGGWPSLLQQEGRREGMLSSIAFMEQMESLMPMQAKSPSNNHTVTRTKELAWSS